ncbi:MAG: type II secretion system secretin GspD [Desulfotignum sp.]|nr:type II secretion system secretin GspD [Desulfotignum sp.]
MIRTMVFSHLKHTCSCLLLGSLLCVIALIFFPVQPVLGQSTPAQDTELIAIDFDNVDIKVFIKFISKITGKNFVLDSRVRGNVTVMSPTRLSVADAYKVFETVLEINGFSVVESGEIFKIIPLPDAKGDNIDTRMTSKADEPSDRLVTRIIPLRYADSDELQRLFIPLLPKGSVMLSYKDTNMLIVTASLASIERLLKIIHAIDAPGIGKTISVIPVKHADAARLVTTLTGIYSARQKEEKKAPEMGMMVHFVADERTNAVVLLANETETLRVEELIDLLDRPAPKGEERIRVFYLEHASAEDLAKVLQELPTRETAKATEGQKQAPLLSDAVHISADKATNSVIIMAEKEDYAVLEDVIAKLDIPRSMVYIECLIMEVNVNRGLDIGTEWRTSQEFDGDQKVGFMGFGGTGDSGYSGLNQVSDDGSLPRGFSLGVLGKNITIGGVTFPDIQAIVRAYQTDKDVHILATPQLLTTENEEAVITVGKNVPFQTRSAAESATEVYSSFEYRDVGITLKITPQISKGRLVRLNVFQELTKLDTVNQNNPDRPTTFKRQIETAIIVEDTYSVVIGGLIDETVTQSESKTPCLGDVPGLGWAFKTISEGEERTNLYVFLTPRVIKNPLEVQQLLDEKKQDMERDFEKGAIPLYQRLDRLRDRMYGPPEQKAIP